MGMETWYGPNYTNRQRWTSSYQKVIRTSYTVTEQNATVLSSDSNESEEEAQPEPSAASKRRGYKDGARGRGTVKEDKKPDAKSKQKKSQADSLALGIQARCTRKGEKPHTAFGQGHTVEYGLTVRVGKTGTVSEHKVATTSDDIKVQSDANPKGQLSLDGKPTKGWNAFLQEFMGDVGQNGVKRIRVPPTCTDRLSDCKLGHIPEDQEIVIELFLPSSRTASWNQRRDCFYSQLNLERPAVVQIVREDGVRLTYTHSFDSRPPHPMEAAPRIDIWGLYRQRKTLSNMTIYGFRWLRDSTGWRVCAWIPLASDNVGAATRVYMATGDMLEGLAVLLYVPISFARKRAAGFSHRTDIQSSANGGPPAVLEED
ncbi:hypothetical protein HDZ31DRAFT_76219 [Schizophyllum fasciatum]